MPVVGRPPEPNRVAAKSLLPAACRAGHALSIDADLAPPPQRDVEPVVWLRFGTPHLPRAWGEPKALEASVQAEVLDIVQSRLRDQDHVVLAPKEAAVFEAEHAARRWEADAPICRAAPPIAAIAARHHPHLIIGTITPMCADGCKLMVWFHRAGATRSSEGLPSSLEAAVKGDDWVAAAARLEPRESQPRLSVLDLGPLDGLALASAENESPWMPIGDTVRARSVDLHHCPRDSEAPIALDVRLDLGAAGEVVDVEVAHLGEHAHEGDAFADCVSEVFQNTGWPCPLDEDDSTLQFRLCL